MFSQSPIDWKKVPFEDASEKYRIEDVSYDELSDLFPDDPEHFMVHEGDVTIDGPAFFRCDDHDDLTVHVIDGNLTIHGPLVFRQGDFYGALYVTGSILCDNAYIASDAQLFVGKSFTVKGVLGTYLSDAGHLSVKGAFSAGHWVQPNDRGAYELHKKPKARMLRAFEARYYVFSDFAKQRAEAAGDAATAEEHEDEAEVSEEDGDEEGRVYGFDPKVAVSLKGVLHPAVVSDGEDLDALAFEAALREGRPLLA